MRKILAALGARVRVVDATDLYLWGGIALLWTTYGPGIAGALLIALGYLPAVVAALSARPKA